ncbi:hypothetical protein BSL78_04996 [Apostichopus japonicus]|uniref:G-protein coupled receptor n=1 Tax=Stichopus japonicus TaxID=307972 RepID=A0A2G8LCW3_STIJA|nr:hypothetical protein BSL78_04996 [Apostichopus japonicus]
MITTTDPTTTEAVTTMITTTDPTTTEAVTTMLTTTDPTTTEAVTTMITTTDPTTTEAVTTMLTTTDPTTTEAVTTMLTMTDPATTEMWTTKQMTTDPTTKMTTTEAATTKVTTKGPSTTEMLTTKMTTIGQTSTEAVTSGGTTDVTTTEQMTTNISTKPDTTSKMTTTNQTSTTGPQTTDTPSTSQADTSPGLTTATPLITDGISCATFPEVITFKSSCYVVANTKRNVTMARRYCHVTYNGYLVTIESSQEQEFLAAHVAGFNDYWIGLSYRSGNRTFHVSGSTGTYLNQLAAQPPYSLNASNICFAMDRINNFLWSPFVCNDTKYFICEIDNLDYVRVTTDMTTTEDVTTTIGVTTIATTDETTVEPTTTVVATTTEEMTTDMTTTEATTTAGFSGCEAEPCLNGATCQELQSDFVCKCEIGFGGVLCEEDLTPDFDPTLSQVIQIEDLLPDGQLLINPYYALGLYHIPLLVTTDDLSEDLHQYENIIHLLNMNVREVKGRRGLGSYPVWTGRSSQLRFLWDTNPINGLSCFDDCSEGFAVSVWLRILATKSEESDPEHIFEIDSPNFVAYAVIAEGSDILLHVSLSSGYKIQRRLLGPDLPEGWFNLGLTWHPDVELESYINGRPADALEYDALINSFSTDTPSVSVCDFTVWDRYVHQFEVHSFLGMDADQFRMMTTADYYWSLDAYVRRDHYVLTNSTDVVAMTTPIETADRDSRKWCQTEMAKDTLWRLVIKTISGYNWRPQTRNFTVSSVAALSRRRGVALYQFGDKLRAVLVDGGREWITEISMENAVPSILPELQCLGDIDQCVDGFSLSLWLYVEEEVKFWWSKGILQIISGREGFSVQLTQQGLFVSLSLNSIRRDYMVSVLNVPVKEWFNLVVTWSQYEDLAVYINGKVMTFDSIAEVTSQDLGSDIFFIQSNQFNVVVKIHSIAAWDKYVYPKKIWQLVGVSVKITSKRVAHLVGLGADVAGEVGFTISQSRQTITAMVSNGTRTWQGTVPAVNITYDEWMYLALLWLPQDGMLLVLDGQVVSSESKPIDDVRESETVGTLVLGGRSRTKRLEATFDEFMLLTPTGSDKLPSAEYYTGSGGLVEGYSSADSYFDVTDPEGSVEAVDTVLTQDRFQNEEGAADTAKNEVKDFGYVTVGDFPFHCLSDPAMCHPAGLTISLWIKMGSTDHFENPATNSEGVGYILSSGAQTSTSHGYSAHFNNSPISTTVVNGTNIWSTSFKYTFGSNWTNYALGWNQRDGLNVFIGGEVKGSNVSGVVLPVVRPSDEFTQLQLGKRNDAEDGYLGAAFDDVAIWIYTFSPDDPELSKTLKGEETKEEEIEVTEDHEELLKVAPLTWKADCQVIHEADCARNVNELLEIVQEQEELTLNATKSIYDRLLNLTSGKTLPDSSDIKASIHVMDEMSKAGLPSGLAGNEAMNIYESFAESVSNLLEDDLYPLWQNISENEYSVAALMENLETLGIQVATRLPVNKEYTGCSTVFKKARLVTCMDRFPIDTFGLTDTILPPIIDLGSNDTNTNNSELLRIDDTIRLPANLFRYTNGGDAATFVFSHFDNLQDVLTSNMSDHDLRSTVPVFHQTEMSSPEIEEIPMTLVPLSPALLTMFAAFLLQVSSAIHRSSGGQQSDHITGYRSTTEERSINPVIITLRTHQQYDNETVDTVCAFWNFTANMGARGWWDTGGCELISSNDTHITCSCNHLTHFAVVSSSIIPIVPNPHHATIAVMGLGLFCVNLFFLGHLVFTLIRHRRLHTLRNTIHLQECLSVFALGLSLVVATMGRNSEGLCQLSAIALQYAALSVLIWIVIEALQLSEDSYRGLHVTDKKHFSRCDDRLKIYYSTGWGLPVLVVATTVAGGTNPHLEIGSGICFLSPLHGAMWAFYAPFIIGILSCVLLLLVVARYYDIHIKRQDRVHSFRSSLRATCILTAYYFVAWIIGYKGLYGEAIWIQYIFVFLLTSLGLVLYLVHGIGNTEIRALLFCEDPDVALTEVQEIYIIPEEEMELPPRPICK